MSGWRFLFPAAAAFAILLAPLWAKAQAPAKVARIGYLATISAAVDEPRFETFRRGLLAFGHAEGKDIVIEKRYANGDSARLNDMAAELARLGVDIFVTVGTPATAAAHKANRDLPIVFLSVTDPVGAGFVKSLARPGGNITGFTNIAAVLAGKRLEILKEAIPAVSCVAVLWDPRNPGAKPQWTDSERPARELKLELHSVEASRVEEIEQGLREAAKARCSALVVTLTPLTAAHEKRLAELSTELRLPAIYPDATFATAGGLMSYGPTFPDVGRGVARYVDKLLKGAKPASLPVEQPASFELVINLQAAKALGITIPQSVLVRADRIIR